MVLGQPGAAALPATPHPGCRDASAVLLLGFLSLTVQSILLREVFGVLYGSDLALAVALASWTLLTACGALAGAALAQRGFGAGAWGLVGYVVVAALVFLGLRAWGAAQVIPFRAYLLLPVFLCLPCLCGGALFPCLVRARAGLDSASAYAAEVMGCLAAGAVCSVLFHLGVLSVPLLAAVLLGTSIYAVRGRGRRIGWAAGVFAATLAALTVSPLGAGLERACLRLHFRDARVEDAANTAFGAFAAIRGTAGTAVVENGVPWPRPEATPSRQSVLAAMLALPERLDGVVFVHALRSGFGPALGVTVGQAQVQWIEEDAAALRFAARHTDVFPPGLSLADVRLGSRGWGPGMGRPDLIAIFSGLPGGLQSNRFLTVEFLRQAARPLGPKGLVCILLPVAPGFTHPDQERSLDSIRQALACVFPAVEELRTELGWTLLLAGNRIPDRQAAVRRLQDRFAALRADIRADAGAIVAGSGIVSLDRLAGPAYASEGRPVSRSDVPANRIAFPHAYFRYIEFRGRFIEEAPVLWRAVFRPWGRVPVILLASALVGTGLLFPGTRQRQVVFWCSWCTTLTLILAIYLYQSLAGQVYWALALLSAASMGGILLGLRTAPGPGRQWARAAAVCLPMAIFPLYALWQALPVTLLLCCMVGVLLASGWGLGYTFARQSAREVAAAATVAGRLFALDLVG
ncbi:MAG: hypothetical protein JXR77_18885, partial [Lentisphaeria bacterium]|nr:hypothetical protein [Lentisphaeria bacterium]